MKTLYVCAALALGGCALEGEGSTASPIIGGSTAARPGSSAVVFLGDCSGVLVDAKTVITAAHCLPVDEAADRDADAISLALRRGAQAETCLTPVDGGCGAWPLAVVRQPASDVIALRSARPFPGVVAGELPQLRVPPAGTAVFAHGYGVDAAGALGTRAAAPIQILQNSDDYIYARTAPGVRVCGGDSGGPLFAESASGPILIGILSATQYDPADPRCTAEAGLNRFARVAPALLRAAAGDPAAFPREAAPTLDDLRAAGIQLIDPAGVTAERIEREQLVGVATEQGDFLARMPALPEQSGAPAMRAGGGAEGELVPLAPRANSLSGNGDQRLRKFVAQTGGIRVTDSTARPLCTGTLIGPRIVRTAKHCTKISTGVYEERPWFTARYDGAPTTWTFDGGATWVTFNPRRADFHFYGGQYFNLNCHDPNTPFSDACVREDWALLIMPQNVWQPVHVIPGYMGTAQPWQGASVGNAGYPKCADMSNPNLTNCQTDFMYGMDCTVMQKHDDFYFSNCDVSPGHSGGGTFITSGGARYLIGHIKGPETLNSCVSGNCTTAESASRWLFNFQNQQRAKYSAVTL